MNSLMLGIGYKSDNLVRTFTDIYEINGRNQGQ